MRGLEATLATGMIEKIIKDCRRLALNEMSNCWVWIRRLATRPLVFLVRPKPIILVVYLNGKAFAYGPFVH